MPFKKGTTTNPTGRPRAAANKNLNGNTKLMKGLNKFLEKNMLNVLSDLETPAAREKARIFCHLFTYTIPKLGYRSGEVRFEDMDQTQLNQLLNMLQENAIQGSGDRNQGSVREVVLSK